MKHTRALLCDLDGTLVDSAPDLAASVAHALDALGMSAPALADIRAYVGEGAARLLHRSLTGDPDGVADDTSFGIASRVFFEHYADNLCVHSRVYPGVTATLERLRREGCALACVTNKPGRFTGALLEATGLAEYFPVCVSGDTLPQKKPDAAPLLHAASALGAAPASCAMIGDTVTDIRAAKNAGMTAVAVDYGYGGITALVGAQADRIAASFADACLPHFAAVS